jgi:hypothetical protein
MTTMKLRIIGTTSSPYTRKVRIVALARIGSELEHRPSFTATPLRA